MAQEENLESNVFDTDPSADWRFFARLPDGRCLVSCHARRAVFVVDGNGTVIERLEGSFGRPEGIAVNSQGIVFVVDRDLCCIHVFDADLKQGMRGIVTDFQPPGRMNQPVGIAINPKNDSIWVADNENHRLLLLDANGKHISTLGSFGSAPGRFFCPCGVALFDHPDHGELIIVSEWGGGRVQVFKAGHEEPFTVFGGVTHAHHVAVDAGGRIFVTEYSSRRIKVFSIDGETYPAGGDQWSASAVSLVADSDGLDVVVTRNQVVGTVVDCRGGKRARRCVC